VSYINMFEAKTNLSRLVEAIESEAEQEIIIARNGRPVARLVPLAETVAHGPRLGIARGEFVVPDTIDELNAEVAILFTGKL
jgi:prevent-host-death family protein